MVYYLQGIGERNDAHFVVGPNNMVMVVAEVGMTGCYDELMKVEDARKVYDKLKKMGWRKVEKSRRSLDELQSDIKD
jgi:hypothetical protein